MVMEVAPALMERDHARLKTYPDMDFGLLLDITAIDYLTYPVNRRMPVFRGIYAAELEEKLVAAGADSGCRSGNRPADGKRVVGSSRLG